MGRSGLIVTWLGLVGCLACSRTPTAEEQFATRHAGRLPYCQAGSKADDCYELAMFENDPAKRFKLLEQACTNGSADGCVLFVGSWDNQRAEVDPARAMALLKRACEDPKPGGACAQLAFRRASPLELALGDDSKLDAATVRYAERACFLGGSRLPLNGLGPGPCYYVARAYHAGVGGKSKDLGRATIFLEAGCEQELDFGAKAGASCYYAARLYDGQPLLGPLIPGAVAVDRHRATSLLKRACDNGQSDACAYTETRKPPASRD